MSPQLPENIRRLGKEELEKAVLRVAIMSEFDSINTYEQIISLLDDGELKAVFLRLINEDKAHAEELQEQLSKRDNVAKSESPKIPEYDDDSYQYY